MATKLRASRANRNQTVCDNQSDSSESDSYSQFCCFRSAICCIKHRLGQNRISLSRRLPILLRQHNQHGSGALHDHSPSAASKCCYSGASGWHEVDCFNCMTEVVHCYYFSHFMSNCVCRNPTTLQIGSQEYTLGVRHVACHVQILCNGVPIGALDFFGALVPFGCVVRRTFCLAYVG